jgi:peroxiredoxin
MKKILRAAALAASLVSMPAFAALKDGAPAPDFTTQASMGGKEFTFALADALKAGPVVLYFYPAAFTKGCTIEAHDFAEATDEFKSFGATVIGLSKDDIATLNKFSVSECQSKFPVGADADGKIMKSYDAKFPLLTMSNRTSYVISPEGKVLYSFTALSPDDHVANTMAVVKKWHEAHQTSAPQ